MQEFIFKPIAIARSCYSDKFGIPRQAGLVPSVRARLQLLPPYNCPEAVAELAQCSHIWVQFVFHQNKHSQWRPKVRPPRLGGNNAIGVFATRSPYRPNPIGLSVFVLERIECSGKDVTLHVSGVDILDSTPILDIKPYVPYTDCIPKATNGIASAPPHLTPVFFSEDCEAKLKTIVCEDSLDLRLLIEESLSQDPRPQYQSLDESRVYGMELAGMNVKWRYVLQLDQLHICVVDLTWLSSGGN